MARYGVVFVKQLAFCPPAVFLLAPLANSPLQAHFLPFAASCLPGPSRSPVAVLCSKPKTATIKIIKTTPTTGGVACSSSNFLNTPKPASSGLCFFWPAGGNQPSGGHELVFSFCNF